MMRSQDEQNCVLVIQNLCEIVHEANKKWWVDLQSGLPLKRNVPEMLMLTVSELAEAGEDSPQYSILLMEVVKSLCRAMEGHRKAKMDDKLPWRRMFEVELADAIIRIFDIAEGLELDLGGAFVEKMAYNAQREDHKLENRRAEGGKKY
jgi:hypothetical protein